MGLYLKLVDLLVYNSRSSCSSSSSNSSGTTTSSCSTAAIAAATTTASSSSSSSSSINGGGDTGTSSSRISGCSRSIFYWESFGYFGKYYVNVKIIGHNKFSQRRHVFNN